jgi:hypothetical protein
VNGPHSLVGVIVARSLTAGGFPISSGGSLAVRTSVVSVNSLHSLAGMVVARMSQNGSLALAVRIRAATR